MTFDQLVAEAKDRLNYTSSDSTTRVGSAINRKYKEVTSSVGLITSRRTIVQQNATLGVVTLTFSGVEKIINVIDQSSGSPRVLQEVTMQELAAKAPHTELPREYALYRVGANTVTIYLDCSPQTEFTLYAEGYVVAGTLSGSQEPAFPESFHDILVEGVLEDEYRKMGQVQLAKISHENFQRRLSELRYKLRTSSYLDITHGGNRELPLMGTGGGAGGGSSVNGAASYTQTGLITFDRDPSAPFAVTSGSARVDNLSVDPALMVIASQAQGDLLYASDADTWARLAKNVTATRYLSNTGGSNNPAWAQINLPDGVTGNLPIANLGLGSLTVSGNTDVGTQNNWAPFAATSGDRLIEWAGASDATITGIANGTIGQRAIIRNTGATNIFFAHQSGSSSVGNKLFNAATSASTPVAPGGSITFVYDGGNWVLVQHEQGAWITPTFAAGSYTGNGSMTWTVASSDVATQAYRLSGRTLHVKFAINTTTVGGTPNTSLQVSNAAWGGFTIAKTTRIAVPVVDNNASEIGMGAVTASATSLAFLRATSANWAAATDTTYVFGVLAFEVT